MDVANAKECQNNTEKGCANALGDGYVKIEKEDWVEEEFMYGFRTWHVMFLSVAGFLTLVILLCCCVKFRIPRTKQEIEGDYVRRKILRKFRKRLKAIHNQELDDMDLKRALDKIRAEFKSDTESIAQSEAGFSVATISSIAPGGPGGGPNSYRRASQIQIDISLEELRAQSQGIGARLALAISRVFVRPKVGQGKTADGIPTPSGIEGGQCTINPNPKISLKTGGEPEVVAGTSTKGGEKKKPEGKKDENKEQKLPPKANEDIKKGKKSEEKDVKKENKGKEKGEGKEKDGGKLKSQPTTTKPLPPPKPANLKKGKKDEPVK